MDDSWHRVFFALWPDDSVRSELACCAKGLDAGGRIVPAAHLHLTLAFLGVQKGSAVERLARRASIIPVIPLTLNLDLLGYFARPQVAWIGPRHSPSALAAWQQQVVDLCLSEGITGTNAVFRPHVTLRRFVQGPREPKIHEPPIIWSVRRWALVESGNEGKPGRYRILAEWGPNGSD